MASNNGLIQKINRAFLLQALLISVAVLMSVFFAKVVIDEILIKNAIKQEADYFWRNYQADPAHPLPYTANLRGYFDTAELPDYLQDKLTETTGFQEFDEIENHLILYTSEPQQQRLYLLYNRGQVDALIAYYGLVPLSLVLIVLYLSLFFTYRFSHKTLSPITHLASQVNQIDFQSTELPSFDIDKFDYDVDDDIRSLSEAIDNFGDRLQAFIARERNFTRDASHELRSPLTVLNIAVDVLLSDQALSKSAIKTIDRIKRAVNDMQELTEMFLLLARESDDALTRELVDLKLIVQEEIGHAELLIEAKQLKINFNAEYDLRAWGSSKVFSVLIGNLLRNAVLYTEQGSVDIELTSDSVIIRDSGQGMSAENVDELFQPFNRGNQQSIAGYGVGLTIVKRLSDRFHWPIKIESNPGQGTRISVQFLETESMVAAPGNSFQK